MAEYTPTDEDMRKRHRHAWEQSPVNRYALEEADAQWSRWLAAHDARVRREAERSALDGLIAQHEREARRYGPQRLHGHHTAAAEDARAYRDTNHPEPFTWTKDDDARRLQSIADGAADHDPEDVTP